MSDLIKLTASEDAVLSAIGELVPVAGGRLSQAELTTFTGRSSTAVSKALRGLESKELITRTAPKVKPLATHLKVSQNHPVKRDQDVPLTGPMLDCFRSSDFINPGLLWQRAPKGEQLTISDVMKLVMTGRSSTSDHLKKLAALPEPAVTIQHKPGLKHGHLYTFNELSKVQQEAIQKDLTARLRKWQPKTIEQRRAAHAQSKLRWRSIFGPAAYSELVPGILDLCAEGPEYRTIKILLDENDKPYSVPHVTKCWMYGGELNKGGYGKVEGVMVPNIMAHRIVYHAHHGTIPDGMEVHHMCRNRACCNPEHLRALYPDEHYQSATVWGAYRYRVSQIDLKHENGSDEWRAARAAADDWLHKQTELEVPIGTARPTNTN